MPRQEFLPADLASKLPRLYSQEKLGKDAIVHAKWFCPWGVWTWYATEYSPKDRIFFGLVIGLEKELGYFSREELESIRGPFGLYIERDEYFKPCTLGELMG